MHSNAAVLSGAGLALTGVLAAGMVQPAAAQWSPRQAVEIVVPFAPGGAVDRISRRMQSIFQDHKLVPNTIVSNRPGGAGNVGWTYLGQQAGSAHFLVVTTPTIMTNYIAGRSKFNYTDFTPLAQLFAESVAFVVAPDSPIKDWNDLVARMRKDPASVSLGSSNREGAAPLTFAMAIKAAGIDPRKMKLAVFNSASQAVTAAMGGHVDVSLSIAATAKGHVLDNRLRALATSAPKRPAEAPYSSVPVLAELGANVSFRSFRGILAPRNLGAAEVAYWDQVFAKMVATEEWEKEVAAADATSEYLDSTKTREFFKAQYEQLKGIMTEIGLAKN